MGDRYYGGLPHASKLKNTTTAQDLADSLEAAAKVLKGHQGDITANIAWAIRKGDRAKVRALLDKYVGDVIGGQRAVNEILQWLDGQLPEAVGMRGLLQRLEEAAADPDDLAALCKALLSAAIQGILEHNDRPVSDQAVYAAVVAKTTREAAALGWRFVGGNDEPEFESSVAMERTIEAEGRVVDYLPKVGPGLNDKVVVAVGRAKGPQGGGKAPFVTVAVFGTQSFGGMALGFKRKA